MSMIPTLVPPSQKSLAASLPEMLAAGLRSDAANRPWRVWLRQHFAAYTTAPFAERHVRYWEWLTSLQRGVRPRPRVEVWPRGGAKSSTTELGCAYLGASPSPQRHYVLYVSETQAQANKHVSSIASMLERVGVRRALNEYGASKGWRHEEIRTANGFNVTAFGLDSGMRGVKLDEYRPDIIVFDDIDGRHDTGATTRKKIDVITETVLPAGSADCAVVIVQNRIAKDSIVSQLCDGRADFLHDRLPPSVEPAVVGLQYEQAITEDGTPRYVITAGTATWEGQNLKTCEQQINDWGVTAFLREAQQEVDEREDGLWQRQRDIDQWRVMKMPEFDRITVAVDPSASANGDEAGIVVAGVAKEYRGQHTDRLHGYVIEDASLQGPPKAWAEASVTAYIKWAADALVAEKNNGGEMVAVTIDTVPGAPPVVLVHASRGKKTRAEPVHKLYEDGLVHHVGTFAKLEDEMVSWKQGDPSPNRLDALVWCLTDLMLDQPIDLAAYYRSQTRGVA